MKILLLLLPLVLIACSTPKVSTAPHPDQVLIHELSRLRYENERLRSGLHKESARPLPLPVDIDATRADIYGNHSPRFVPLRGTNQPVSPPTPPNVIIQWRTNTVYVLKTNSQERMLADAEWFKTFNNIPYAVDRESVERYKRRKEAERIMIEQLDIIRQNQ